jgi:hypothetical protein
MGLRHTQVYPINLKLDGTPPHAGLKIKVIIRGRMMEVEGWICTGTELVGGLAGAMAPLMVLFFY